MSRPFGWCMAPEGALPDHEGCPGVIGGADGLRCGCSCGCVARGLAGLQQIKEVG